MCNTLKFTPARHFACSNAQVKTSPGHFPGEMCWESSRGLFPGEMCREVFRRPFCMLKCTGEVSTRSFSWRNMLGKSSGSHFKWKCMLPECPGKHICGEIYCRAAREGILSENVYSGGCANILFAARCTPGLRGKPF